MGNHVAIIGSGAIGRWSAYYLAKKGYRITLIDKGNLNEGCSFGNAGMIVPSHVIPLAAPGMVTKGIRWMMNSSSPFYVRPRLNPELMRWGRLFLKNASQVHVDRSKIPLRDLSLLSSDLYKEVADHYSEFEFRSTGLLMAYQSEKVGEEEIEAGRIALELGLEVEFLNASEVQSLEPKCTLKTVGGVLYKSDGLIDPNKTMVFLENELDRLGVEMLSESEVTGFEKSGGIVTNILLKTSSIRLDQLVIAGGAWSAGLAKFLGEKIPLLPGKGYSFSPDHNPGLLQPAILCEGKVAVSPFGDRIRFGGTMEITNVRDQMVHRKRVQGIIDTVAKFYPDLKIEFPEDIWSGFRPCSPDGLPYIGSSDKFKNVHYATGHGMMGISLAPATGKLVTELVQKQATSIDIKAFRINRF